MFLGTAVGNTDMFSEPDTRHTLKYGHVFPTRYAPHTEKHTPIFQHLADGGNHDREVWPTFGAVHFKNNVLKTYL